MSEIAANVYRTTEFTASDGAELIGDLTLPPAPWAAAILCHPHPRFGGNRHDTVVAASSTALVAAGMATLRFDFRTGFDNGVGERRDALAALDELAAAAPDIPLAVVGYSFGAMIAIALDDHRIRAQVVIAPPLDDTSPPPRVPTLVLMAAHDQFSPPDIADPVIDGWLESSTVAIDREVIESADHFLAGHTADVAARAARWLGHHIRTSPPMR